MGITKFGNPTPLTKDMARIWIDEDGNRYSLEELAKKNEEDKDKLLKFKVEQDSNL